MQSRGGHRATAGRQLWCQCRTRAVNARRAPGRGTVEDAMVRPVRNVTGPRAMRGLQGGNGAQDVSAFDRATVDHGVPGVQESALLANRVAPSCPSWRCAVCSFSVEL